MNHQGMALLAGLLLLSAVSLLALIAANGMILQSHQTANFGDKIRAAENAAIAEAQARAWLISRPDIERQPGCLTGCVLPVGIRGPDELPQNPEFESAAWWRINGVQAGTHPETGEFIAMPPGGKEPARWIIEELRFEPTEASANDPVAGGLAYYRVLSRGTGSHPGSVAVTETIMARPWEGDFEEASFPSVAAAEPFCRQFNGTYPCGTQAWRQRR